MIPEEPRIEASEEGVSRRKMLKRVGAGAAVAWSAPVLTSIKKPAFAQGSPRCVPFDLCGANPDFCGQPGSACGDLPPGCAGAGCTVLIDGSCLCWDFGYFCDPDGQTCQSDADCQSGLRCGRINAPCACNTGDDTACRHPCGAGSAPRSGPRGTKVVRPNR